MVNQTKMKIFTLIFKYLLSLIKHLIFIITIIPFIIILVIIGIISIILIFLFTGKFIDNEIQNIIESIIKDYYDSMIMQY